MKKILLILLLMPSLLMANEPFVRQFNYYAEWDNSINSWGDWEKSEKVTVVFNYKNTTKVKFYYASGNEIMLYPVGSVEKRVNNEGEKYQKMKYIDDSGQDVYLYLFDRGEMSLWMDDSAIIFSYF